MSDDDPRALAEQLDAHASNYVHAHATERLLRKAAAALRDKARAVPRHPRGNRAKRGETDMSFDEWKAALCAKFDALGGDWTGYGLSMLEADPEGAEEAWREGVTPHEMFESELDAAL